MKNVLVLVALVAALIMCLTPSVEAQQTSPLGYIEMPPAKDGSYIMTGRPGDGRRWGRPDTIRMLMMVAREWNKRHGGKYKLRIGDISKPDGTNFPPHKTHKNGLAIDITTSPNICSIHWKDQKLTLELAQLFYHYGAWQIFYNDSYVISQMPNVVRKLVKHDTHFHVNVHPNRVPKGDGPFVVSAPPVTDRSWVGTEYVKKTESGWTRLPLRWMYLGGREGWQKSFIIEVADRRQKVLWTSEPIKSRRALYRIPYGLKHHEIYYWRVTATGRDKKEIKSGWFKIKTDFTPPTVMGVSPAAGDKTESAPTFKWIYKDKESEQYSFQIQIDNNKSHKRVWKSFPMTTGRATSHRLTTDLRKRKTYYWRVVVRDGRGNTAASEWTKFKVTKRSKIEKKMAVVTSKTLNMRHGPGTNHRIIGRLRKGQQILIIRSGQTWHRVRARLGRKILEGFVHKNYIREQ